MFTYFPNINMQYRKLIILFFVAICTAFASGLLVGQRERASEWCRNYMGTGDLRECRLLSLGTRPIR